MEVHWAYSLLKILIMATLNSIKKRKLDNHNRLLFAVNRWKWKEGCNILNPFRGSAHEIAQYKLTFKRNRVH